MSPIPLLGRRRTGWPLLFSGGRTPVANPGVALLSETKRLPIVWDRLHTAMPTWRALLPETRDPRDAPWQRGGDGWIVKAALTNTGDSVAAPDLVPPDRWRRTSWDVRMWPGQWVAQRRFETRAVDTPAGAAFPCVGVYTVDGRAAGAYGRLAVGRPVVDFAATDVAVLVRPDREAGPAGADAAGKGAA